MALLAFARGRHRQRVQAPAVSALSDITPAEHTELVYSQVMDAMTLAVSRQDSGFPSFCANEVCHERAGLGHHFVLHDDRGLALLLKLPSWSRGPAEAEPKKRCKPPASVTREACWNISRGGFAGKAHADTCQRTRPRAQKRPRVDQERVSGGTRASVFAASKGSCSLVASKNMCIHHARARI